MSSFNLIMASSLICILMPCLHSIRFLITLILALLCRSLASFNIRLRYNKLFFHECPLQVDLQWLIRWTFWNALWTFIKLRESKKIAIYYVNSIFFPKETWNSFLKRCIFENCSRCEYGTEWLLHEVLIRKRKGKSHRRYYFIFW